MGVGVAVGIGVAVRVGVKVAVAFGWDVGVGFAPAVIDCVADGVAVCIRVVIGTGVPVA